jgi:hypothetical protein
MTTKLNNLAVILHSELASRGIPAAVGPTDVRFGVLGLEITVRNGRDECKAECVAARFGAEFSVFVIVTH